jgi:adenine deaminase
LKTAGAVAPGRRADLAVFSDLEAPRIELVFCRGQLVAENGRMSEEVQMPPLPELPRVMNLDPQGVRFAVPAAGDTVRVIALVPGQVMTGNQTAKARIVNGRAEADVKRDLLKLAVVERYSGKAGTGIGFVRGFGLKKGALASSVAHDSHNIISVGAGDADMKAAVAEIARLGGGLAVAADGAVKASLALPIAGLMSPEPMPAVRRRLDELTAAARALGSVPNDPFMALSFLALPVIPELKLTDRGLVDVEAFCPVPLFL